MIIKQLKHQTILEQIQLLEDTAGSDSLRCNQAKYTIRYTYPKPIVGHIYVIIFDYGPYFRLIKSCKTQKVYISGNKFTTDGKETIINCIMLSGDKIVVAPKMYTILYNELIARLFGENKSLTCILKDKMKLYQQNPMKYKRYFAHKY